jgi:hypothetical protein
VNALSDLQRQKRREHVDVCLHDGRSGAEGAEKQIDLLAPVEIGEATERCRSAGKRLDAAGVGEGVDRPRCRAVNLRVLRGDVRRPDKHPRQEGSQPV